MAKHRNHSADFKRQVAQEFRIWVAKYEAGAFDDDARAADLLQEYEAKIAALERMVGRQALKFVINLKTAKTLGLTVPPGVLAIADEVIE